MTLAGVNAGGRDKTRMKQAMLNRKSDINADGSAKSFESNTFGV
jgi:hypothetical protein